MSVAGAALQSGRPAPVPSAEDILRSDLYALLGSLLGAPPGPDMLGRIAGLDGDATELGKATTALARIASGRSAAAIAREYTTLFVGLSRGELLPYASYYLTGFLHEKPLARLRADLARLGIARNRQVSEPEDHIATLCEVMAGTIRGSWGAPLPLAAQAAFYDAHLAPWAEHFFADLDAARGSVFYAPVGRIGRVFMGIEAEAFRMGGQSG